MSIPPDSAGRMVEGARQHNHQARIERNIRREIDWHDQDRGAGCAVALIPLSISAYLVAWILIRFLF